MVNRKYNKSEDLIHNLQQLKGKSNLIFDRNFSNFYDETKYHRQNCGFPFEEKTCQWKCCRYWQKEWLMKYRYC